MTNVRRNLAVQLIPIGGANPLKMRLSATAFIVGTAGVTGALVGQGGVPAYAYSIVSGSLPTGLSLNSSTGIISGTPSAAANFTFAAQIQDSALTAYIATFSINVAHIVQPLQFTPPAYDAGTGNKTYQFTVSGSTGAVTWSATGLPAWATMSSGGLLTVATSSVFPAASATISVTASDAGTGDSYTASVRLVVVQALQVILTTACPTNITIGTTVTFDAKAQIVPFGGQTPYLYQLVASVNPAAPSWVSINPTTGVLTFSPPPTYSPQTIAFDYVISDIAGGSRVVTIRAPFVNPNNIIQNQQNGSNVGSPGASTFNFIGANVSVVGGVATITTGVADFYGVASGTNTYTATTGVTALSTGELFVINFANANTAASTLNVDSLGAVAIQLAGAALVGGEIQAGATYELVYDGSVFQIIGAKATVTGSVVTVTSNTTLVGTGPSNRVIVNAAATTQTLPASLSAGDEFIFLSTAVCTSLTINPNGKPIQAVAGNMTVDLAKPDGSIVNFSMAYLNATEGWTTA